MIEKMMWHDMQVIEPKNNIHILVELDDHSFISGNMTTSEQTGDKFFLSDNPLSRTLCGTFSTDEILRWCIAPESD